jgi:hypothetical protein
MFGIRHWPHWTRIEYAGRHKKYRVPMIYISMASIDLSQAYGP